LYKITTMPEIKIKASKVSSLTDARYFAAAGVDFLGFCCNVGTELYCSPAKIREITAWVEGPEFVLELDGWQSEEEIYTIIQSELGQALHFGAFAQYDKSFGLPVFQDFILENIGESDFSHVDFPVIRSERSWDLLEAIDIENVRNLCAKKNVFLDLPFTPGEWAQLNEQLPIYGIIVRGGEEEKTGFKSFDNLDLLFDVLS
jgi:phosphoribosylanthranilate isomerase